MANELANDPQPGQVRQALRRPQQTFLVTLRFETLVVCREARGLHAPRGSHAPRSLPGRPTGSWRRQRLGDGADGSGSHRGARRGVGERRGGSARDGPRHRPGSRPAAAATAAAEALAAARGRDGRRGGGRSRAGTGTDGSWPVSRSGLSWGTVGRARVSVPARVTPCVRQSVTDLRALGTVHSSRDRGPWMCPTTFW